MAPGYLGLRLGRLEWQGLEPSGSFFLHICLVPGLGTVDTNMQRVHSTVCGSSVLQEWRESCMDFYGLSSGLIYTLRISHTLLVETVSSLLRFKGRVGRFHFLMRQLSKNLQPCWKTAIPYIDLFTMSVTKSLYFV